MRETGIIWVLLATLSVMTAFAFVKSAEVQKGLSRQQAAFGATQRTIRRQQGELKRQAWIAAQTTHSSCAYRALLDQESQQGSAYLKRHPDGAPALGVSAAQIARSIEAERRASSSMSVLVCKKRKPAPPPPRKNG